MKNNNYKYLDILTVIFVTSLLLSNLIAVIWLGFATLIVSTIIVQTFVWLPPATEWHNQDAYERVFGIVPRVVFASVIAFWAGEFTNSFTMAKMKILTKGKYLWTRTIGSTVCGEAVDTLIFYPVAFLGLESFPISLIIKIMIANYILKVLWEVIATPFTYKIVAFLKKAESEDYYDYGTDFSPFTLHP